MFTIRVIPISKIAPQGELTYFSATEVPMGTLVTVPLRKKKIPALVITSEPVAQQKAALKRGTFALKKVTELHAREIFLRDFLNVAEDLAHQYAAPVGAILRSLLPFSLVQKLPELSSKVISRPSQERLHIPIQAYEAPYTERLATYTSIIRSSFAKGESVYVIAPTIEEVSRLHEKLQKGIEHRSFLLTSSGTPKEILSTWKEASLNAEPVLVCMTASFLSLPRADLGYIILERESSRSHRLSIRPFLHTADTVAALGKHMRATSMYADEMLSTVTRARVSSGLYEAYEELRPRIPHTDNIHILDIRRNKDEPKKTFTPIHPTLATKISSIVDANQSVFLFGSRKGYANAVVCSDCGERVSCDVCTSPVALETTARGRIFVCRRCHATRSAKERCKACDSWNLIELGIGSERIHEYAASLFGKNRVFRLDAETAPDHAKARALYETWKNKPGSILVGTERALPFLRDRIPLSGVVALDSLLALPEWQAYERVFSILIQLSGISQEVIVQTRRPDEPVLKHATDGSVKEFIDEELVLRKQFGFPPFVFPILASITGTESRVLNEQKKLAHLLQPWGPRLSARKVAKGKVTASVLISIPNDSILKVQIPNELLTILRNLPPYVSVVMNPDSTRA